MSGWLKRLWAIAEGPLEKLEQATERFMVFFCLVFMIPLAFYAFLSVLIYGTPAEDEHRLAWLLPHLSVVMPAVGAAALAIAAFSVMSQSAPARWAGSVLDRIRLPVVFTMTGFLMAAWGLSELL